MILSNYLREVFGEGWPFFLGGFAKHANNKLHLKEMTASDEKHFMQSFVHSLVGSLMGWFVY